MAHMKIGIYKVGKRVMFLDDDADTAAWSYEVVNCFKILQGLGHDVHMLSPTDDPSVRGEPSGPYERIILVSGSFELEALGVDIVHTLRHMTPRLDFLFTDMRLHPPYKMWHLFDNVYSQSTQGAVVIGGSYVDVGSTYAHIADLIAYGFTGFTNTVEEAISGKDVEFFFGGTERGRLQSFLEYVWRPGHVVYTKSASLAIENRSGRHEYLDTLSRSKFSIVIADEDYNTAGFVTPRPYEAWVRDVVTFVEKDFDPDAMIVPKNDYFRVANYVEMRRKMAELLNDKTAWAAALEVQRSRITNAICKGERFARVVGV